MSVLFDLRLGAPCKPLTCKVMNSESGCICAAGADEIERLRTALEYIVEYCEETSLSREDKIAHTLRKARTALGGKE